MNERIKELEAQCWEHDQSWTGLGQRVFNREKFAQLIVKECLGVVSKEHKLALEFNWDNDDTATTIKDSIKKHFGVE